MNRITQAFLRLGVGPSPVAKSVKLIRDALGISRA
jgi:hypothetical protein